MAFGRRDLMVVLCSVLVILAPTRTHGLCWPECMRECDDFKIVCGTACVIACMGKSPFYNHYHEPELITVPGPAAAPSPAHRALLKMRESPPGFAGNSNSNSNSNNKSKEEEETTTTSSSSLFSQFP
uniref:Uncharacterized protein n=1 Tax=Ananas comosus var. bracteatus TaxID=296719 RepID=A0A6V7PZI6_ANACO|nr:unnamed protein product [Ananas comosus var. bracteatus]